MPVRGDGGDFGGERGEFIDVVLFNVSLRD